MFFFFLFYLQRTIIVVSNRRSVGLVAHAARVHRRVTRVVHRMHPEIIDRLRVDTAELFVDRRGPEHRRLRRDAVRRRFVPSRRQLLAGHGHEAALPLPPGARHVRTYPSGSVFPDDICVNDGVAPTNFRRSSDTSAKNQFVLNIIIYPLFFFF